MTNRFFWELLESEAKEKFFFERSPEPVIVIGDGMWSPANKCTLYFARGLLIEHFPSMKKARNRAFEILSKDTKNRRIVHVTKKRKRVLDAELIANENL